MKDPRTQMKISVSSRDDSPLATPQAVNNQPRKEQHLRVVPSSVSTQKQQTKGELGRMDANASETPKVKTQAAASSPPTKELGPARIAAGPPSGGSSARRPKGSAPPVARAQVRWALPRSRRFAGRPRGPGSFARQLPPAMWAGGLLALALLLPVLVVATRHHQPPAPAVPVPVPPIAASKKEAQPPQVSVYLSKMGQVETLPLEDYVTGVIAAEMPASFELEALKAQAVAARTFIVRRLVDNDKSGVPEASAAVTDTVSHQAYLSKSALENWKAKGKSAQLAKLKRAVLETKNIIMTYHGKPITASFFSTSNGYTENSEDYWNVNVPYLRSVASPWDQKIAPGFKESVTFTRSALLTKLGIDDQAVPTFATGKSFIQILSSTVGHRIKQASVGGTIFTGREIREKLGLRSSEFSWEMKGNNIILTTYGYGHGVGMSQWGADGMAKEGYTATQILKYYYTGIEFQQASKLLKK